MKLGATIFLRGVLVLLGLGALAFLLVEPRFEGRNAHATLFEIYFRDPFLAYLYVGSIPFFVGLWHGIRVLAQVGRNEEFSPSALRSVRVIRNCALGCLAAIAGAELFILLNESDDRAGGVAMGVIFSFGALLVVTAMTLLERTLQKAVDLQSEHDLTV